MYLARIQLAGSEFLIIYSTLPPLILAAGEVPAKIVSALVALAVVFLTVRYKYLVLLPTTAFSGSFIFWEVAVRYTDIGNEKLNGIIMGIIAFAFQCYISREQLKNTYEDVKKKVKKTEKGGEKAVSYVERKVHTKDLHLKNIRLKGVKNARDLGGIPVAGGTIKPKRLIRAGSLYAINKSGEDKLKNDYNLKIVVDLRNSAEKSEKPDKPIEGITFLEMPVFDSSIPGISHESKKDLDHVPSMTKLYEAVVNGGSFKNLCNAVRNIVHLCDNDYSILFHCTEGKDRTGMVTAMLLTVLGAKREDILKDYLFTNKTNRKKALTLYQEIDENSRPTAVVVSGPKHVTKAGMYAFCWPGCLTVMYDREKVGLIQIEDIKKNNDYALWLRVCQKADCYLLAENLARYRRGREGSISNHSIGTLIKWHYKLWHEAEHKNRITSLWYTGLNLICGCYKKMRFVKKGV